LLRDLKERSNILQFSVSGLNKLFKEDRCLVNLGGLLGNLLGILGLSLAVSDLVHDHFALRTCGNSRVRVCEHGLEGVESLEGGVVSLELHVVGE
jgi:hypothetical protein